MGAMRARMCTRMCTRMCSFGVKATLFVSSDPHQAKQIEPNPACCRLPACLTPQSNVARLYKALSVQGPKLGGMSLAPVKAAVGAWSAKGEGGHPMHSA